MMLDKAINKLVIASVLVIALTPILWPTFSKIETEIYPVVTPADVYKEEVLLDGAIPSINVWVKFDITRQCQFEGLTWYSSNNVRLPIIFPPKSAGTPDTRPMGPQNTGPWTLVGITDLVGTRSQSVHSCHPLWKTRSTFYDGGDNVPEVFSEHAYEYRQEF